MNTTAQVIFLSSRKSAPYALRKALLKGVLIRHPNRVGLSRTVVGMDNRVEVREFLLSRRAKITPEQAGLPDVGTRRVPGLRRGEVAALAGVSVEYYGKLERGAIGGVSAGRCHVVCVNTPMEVSTDDGCCGIRTWDAGGVRTGV